MQNIKPHWGWFLLGPAVLILGGIASVVLMAGGLMSVAEGMQRVDAPGEAVIRIEQPGEQAIFFEQRGVAAASAPADLKLSITPLAGGEPLSISNTFGSVTYNANGVAGRNYGSVNFPATGEYKVVVATATGGGQVALGGNPGEKIVGSLLGFFGVGFGSFVACVIILIVVAVKRAKFRKALLRQQYATYPAPVR